MAKNAIEITSEDVSLLMGTNFESAFNFAQLLHPLLKSSGNGSIVFNSSLGSMMSFPCSSVYSAAKGTIFSAKL